MIVENFAQGAFDMDIVAQLLSLDGIKTSVKKFGIDTAAIYCTTDDDAETIVTAGPGCFDYEGLAYPVATVGDFYIGSVIDGESGFYYDGSNDEFEIAEQISQLYFQTRGQMMADTPLRNIRVSDKLWNAVKKKAAKEGITVTAIVIAAFMDFLAE